MFKFANVLAGSYRGGSLAFSGDSLLAGCGNRLWAKNLVAHSSFASSFETVEDLEHILPLENEDFVVIIDKGGRMSFVNGRLLTVLTTVHLKGRVTACAINPETRKCAVATQDRLTCWKLPCASTGWQFSRISKWRGHSQRCRGIRFSPDNRFLITCGDDNTIRFWSANADPEFYPLMFTDAISSVLAADYSEDMQHVVAIAESGHIYTWRWHSEPLPEKMQSKLREAKARAQGRFKTSIKADLKNVKNELKIDDEVIEDSSIVTDLPDRCKRSFAELSESAIYSPVMTTGWWEILPSYRLPVIKGTRFNYTAAEFHRAKRLLVLGTGSGQLATVQINLERAAESLATELARVQVAVDEGHVGSLKFNPDGEWIAAGLPGRGGTLCVWEWRSSTFILRETAIDPGLGGVTAVAVQSVSTDSGTTKTGQLLGCSSHLMATGYGDGRVVIWDTVSGFELKRFSEHTGCVSGLCFTNQQHTLVSCSISGEIKCYELVRMRCFRTIYTPNIEGDASDVRVPIGRLSVDGSGSLICAASSGSDCSLFVYSMTTGRLVDTFSAHTTPVVDLQFNLYNIRQPGQLAAVCLDGTVCIWNLFERDAGGKVTLSLMDHEEDSAYSNNSGGFSLAWNPLRHNELAVALGGGDIVIWNLDEEEILKRIDGSRDIEVGREKNQLSVVKSRDFNRSFDRMAYSGSNRIVAVSLLSACAYVYDLDTCSLLFKWKITHNRTYENLARKLNAKQVVDADFDLSDLDADEMEKNERRGIEKNDMPGASHRFGVGDRLVLRKQFRIRDMALSFDGQNLVIGSSHGAFCYRGTATELTGRFANTEQSLYQSLTSFSPMQLDDKTTQKKFQKAVQSSDMSTALKLSLRINDPRMIALVYERVQTESIETLAQNLDSELVPVMINFIRSAFELHRTSMVSTPSSVAGIVNEKSQAEMRCSTLLEIHLVWLVSLLNWQRSHNQMTSTVRPLLLAILKDLLDSKRNFINLLNDNRLTAAYLGNVLGKTISSESTQLFQYSQTIPDGSRA